MNRGGWVALALLLLAAGLLWVATREETPARTAATDAAAGRPTLVGASGGPGALSAPEDGRRGASASQATSDASPEPAPGGEEAATEAATEHPLTPEEVERLVRSVGERGALALADDPVTNEVQQRLEAAGRWTWARLPESLRATDPALRLGAAALLAVHGDSSAGRALADQLDRESDPTVRRILVEALAGLESPAGADALLRVWEDPGAPEGSRRLALQGLGSLGHAAARRALQDVRTSAPHRRLAEIGLVRAYRVRGAVDPTLRGVVESIATSSPNEASRREAEEALGAASR